jgi:hypothetical protein
MNVMPWPKRQSFQLTNRRKKDEGCVVNEFSKGCFGRFQGEYAARGVNTFPYQSNTDDKRPLTKGYHRVGRKGSAALAEKFGDAPGIATMAGKGKVPLVLVDIDARGADADRILGDIQNRFGPPKVVVKTGKDGRHAYYRHNGEGRQIRPDPKLPVDILGGGAIILPPSLGLVCDYQFIEGGIDDLPDLPVMRRMNSTSIQPDITPSVGLIRETKVGERDKTIYPVIARLAQGARTHDALVCEALDLNAKLKEPLTDAEITAKCNYWWGKTVIGKNRFSIGQDVRIDHGLVDTLMVQSPDAFNLLVMLKRHHWNRDFAFANAIHKTMGWTLRRLVAARQVLIDQGLVLVIRRHTQNKPMFCRLPSKSFWQRGKKKEES